MTQFSKTFTRDNQNEFEKFLYLWYAEQHNDECSADEAIQDFVSDEYGDYASLDIWEKFQGDFESHLFVNSRWNANEQEIRSMYAESDELCVTIDCDGLELILEMQNILELHTELDASDYAATESDLERLKQTIQDSYIRKY